MKKYDKLVRDKIPQIIAATGQTCKIRILDREEYIQKLDEKLCEELAEYQESKSMEELADLLEVMEAVAEARGFCWQDVLTVRAEKKEKRGGFQKRLLLEYVKEEEDRE